MGHSTITSHGKDSQVNTGKTLFADEPKIMLLKNLFDRCSLLLFGALAVIFLLTAGDYGYSWDEVHQNRWYGQAVLRFIHTIGADRSAMHTNDYYLYGGLYDALAELIPYIYHLDGFMARRVANAFIGLLAIAGSWKTARMLAGPLAGFLAMLFLISIPAWYGHVFINAKDIPFAAGYIWSLYYILKIVRHLPEMSWKTAVGLGAAFGLSIGIRIGGVLVIIYFFLTIGLYLIGLLATEGSSGSLKAATKSICNIIPISLGIAVIMMFTFWPTVLVHPLTGLIDAFQATSHFAWEGRAFSGSVSVLLNGEYVNSTELPWYYLPVYFGVKLPVPILLLLVTGLGWGILRIVQSFSKYDWTQIPGPGLLIFAILFPPVYAVLAGATIYDGIRHFLFIIPPMACLTGMALANILKSLENRIRHARVFICIASIVFLSFHGWIMIQLHPYQYTYLNTFAGGIPAGSARYETDYWITSYREASLKLLAYAKEYAKREEVRFEEQLFDVAVYGNEQNVKPFLPNNFVVTNLEQTKRADFYIATTRYGSDKILPQWRIIARVERMGMLFAVVKTSLPILAGEND